ncbi:MAG TPA: type IV pilus biogenesis/stability protein PilW [Gammaproteobacteria bacterium]
MKTTRISAALVAALALPLLSACVSTGGMQGSDLEAARVNTQLAMRYLQRGNVDIAMEKVDRALEQNDDYAEAWLVKGMILARAKEYDDADDYYERAARLGEKNSAVLNNVAAYFCSRGRFRDGEELFLKVAAMPTFARPAIAYTNAGMCARRIPEMARAERHLRRALELEPAYPLALWHMAELSLERGEPLSARAFLQRLEGVQPLGPDGLWLGVRVERELGDPEAERRYANILLRDFPESREAELLTNGDPNE